VSSSDKARSIAEQLSQPNPFGRKADGTLMSFASVAPNGKVIAGPLVVSNRKVVTAETQAEVAARRAQLKDEQQQAHQSSEANRGI
jgi:hypothetical protein